MAASHPTDVDRRFPAEPPGGGGAGAGWPLPHRTAAAGGSPAEPATVAAARREMETLGWALDAEESKVVALLVSEMVTNSVQHAATSKGEHVRLEAHVTDAVLRVSVTDGGDGFVAPFRSDGSPLGSHWGLHVVDALVDRWEVAR